MSFDQFYELFEQGDLDGARQLLEPLDYQQRLAVVKDAIVQSRYHGLQPLKELWQLTFPSAPRKMPFPPQLLDLAAKEKNLQVLDWLVEQYRTTNRPFTPPIKGAAQSNSVPLVNKIAEKFQLDLASQADDLMREACEAGAYRVAMWLHDQYSVDLPPDMRSTLVSSAVANGADTEALRWMRERDVPLSVDVLIAAIEHNNLDAINFFYKYMNEDECEEYIEQEHRIARSLVKAAAAGYHRVIDLLFDKLDEFDEYEFPLIDAAIKHGQVRVFETIKRHTPLSGDQDDVDRMYLTAARYGQVQMMDYFYVDGFRFNEDLLLRLLDDRQDRQDRQVDYASIDLLADDPEDRADRAGPTGPTVNAVKFLRLHGAAVDEDVLQAAEKYPDIYKYLAEREQPLPSAIALVARHGLTSVLARFAKEGYPLDATVADQAAEFGQLSTLRWLHEHGVFTTDLGRQRAEENDFDDVVKFLDRQ